jgi:4-hydroxybenzoate polyprenyltransferase
VTRYLELVRIFLAPSAAADCYAGLFLASALTGRAPGAGTTLMAVAASILLYSMGMVANDIFDLPRDRERAPHRPLPSGRVSLRAAVVLAGALGALALGLAAIVGVLPIAAGIALAALIYDGGGKRIPVLGNLLMGACRALNFLLGASAVLGVSGAMAERSIASGALILGLFIAGVTAASRLEDAPLERRRLVLAAAALGAVPAALLALAWRSVLAWVNAAVLAATLGAALRAGLTGAGPHHPAQVFVRNALGGIYFVDAGIIIAFSPPGTQVLDAVLVLVLLALLAWRWKVRWMERGSAGS